MQLAQEKSRASNLEKKLEQQENRLTKSQVALKNAKHDLAKAESKLKVGNSVKQRLKDSEKGFHIIFDGNMWYLRPEHKGQLALLAKDMLSSDSTVQLIGHTDIGGSAGCFHYDEYGEFPSTSSRDTNLVPVKGKNVYKKCFKKEFEKLEFLGKKRAQSAKNYLVKLGVPESNVTIKGVGAAKLLYGSDDARNRRVEVVFN